MLRTPTRWRHVPLIALACLFMAWAGADTLTLESGEAFTGQMSRIVEGTLVFRTALSGQMMVPMDTVQRLTTERNYVVTSEDGQILYGRLDFGGATGGEHLVPVGGGEPVPLALSAIVEAEPLRSAPAAPTASETTGELGGMAVRIETGVQWREGNTGRIEPVGRLQLSGGDEGGRITADIEVAQGGGDDLPGFAAGSVLVEDTTGTSGPYARVEALRNADAALAIRARLGLGLRHLLYDSDTTSLTLATGGAAMVQQWDTGLVSGHDEWPSAGQVRQEEVLELELGLRYSRMFFGGSTLEEHFAFLPSLSQPGEFRALSDTVVRVPLSDAVQLQLNLRLYYDSDPAFGSLDPWETSVGAGLAIEF